MKTELQYNLQKARALATELRVTLETVSELLDEQGLSSLGEEQWWPDRSCDKVSGIESILDELTPSVIGEGHVALSVEPFQ